MIPGFEGNRETQTANVIPSDMVRLNYRIPPVVNPNRLGLLGGDVAGFPNGRRVGDDVTDIDLKAAAGAVLHVLGQINCPASLTLGDNVDGNDVPYLGRFPYLGWPHQGYSHDHRHGGPPIPGTNGPALPVQPPPPPLPPADGDGDDACPGGPFECLG